uniref:Uncharacterized protein n=1 Tax=Anguilla anguilla TaxID=7936 RepID=A0A0E9THH3_ANGAN
MNKMSSFLVEKNTGGQFRTVVRSRIHFKR